MGPQENVMSGSVGSLEERGVQLGQFTGEGYNINKEKGKRVHRAAR